MEKKMKLKRINNIKNEINKSFGKKTEDQYLEIELIERYWKIKSANIKEIDRIDDVTWYDWKWIKFILK